MQFSQMMAELNSGSSVRRTSWPEYRFIQLLQYGAQKDIFIKISEHVYDSETYYLSYDDLTASDWELYVKS